MLHDLIKISKSQILVRLVLNGSSLSEVFNLAERLEREEGKRLLLSDAEVFQHLYLCQQSKIGIISILDDSYPVDLKSIQNPPLFLYVKGEVNLLKKVKFAIVGARASTFESNVLAQQFATELSEYGFTIVSGFANGVDANVVKGSYKFGTIQVLGSGVDVIYPKENAKLYNEVIEYGGLFISELPPKSPARGENFPMRNRIISGLSKGVLLVQASKKNGSSGSLITAKMALNQGKYLFAIPGHPFDSKFEGGNDLIKYGNAIFTTKPKDIFDLLSYTIKERRINGVKLNDISGNVGAVTREDITVKNELKKIFGTKPLSIDEIVQMTNIDVSKVQILVAEMEILNEIQRHHDGRFSLTLL